MKIDHKKIKNTFPILLALLFLIVAFWVMSKDVKPREIVPQQNTQTSVDIPNRKPEIKDEEVRYGTGIYKDGLGLYFMDKYGREKKRLDNFSDKNLRVFGNDSGDNCGYSNQRGYSTIYPPCIMVNDSKVVVVDPYENEVTYFDVKSPKDFKEIADSIYTDKIDFYIFNNETLHKLPINNGQIVPDSFYIKTDTEVFYLGTKLLGADPKTFELVKSKVHIEPDQSTNYQYAKDKNRVYFKENIIKGSNPETFSAFDRRFYQDYAKDKNNVYYENEIIDDADPETFTPIGYQPWEGCSDLGRFSKDKNHAYYKTRIIDGADPKTFKNLNSDYARDAIHTFYKDIMLDIRPDNLVIPCHYG